MSKKKLKQCAQYVRVSRGGEFCDPGAAQAIYVPPDGGWAAAPQRAAQVQSSAWTTCTHYTQTNDIYMCACVRMCACARVSFPIVPVLQQYGRGRALT